MSPCYFEGNLMLSIRVLCISKAAYFCFLFATAENLRLYDEYEESIDTKFIVAPKAVLSFDVGFS